MNRVKKKLKAIAENMPLVYEAGKAEGGDNPLYYARQLKTLFIGADFPKDYELILKFKNTPITFDQMFFNANCPEKIKIITENLTNSTDFQNAFRITSAPPNLISLDLGDLGVLKNMFQCFDGQKVLKTVVGKLNLTGCTGEIATTNMFRNCSSLADIEFAEGTIPVSISFANSPLLSEASVQSIIDGLAELTGNTKQTVTFNADVVITDGQKATINGKNWSLSQI